MAIKKWMPCSMWDFTGLQDWINEQAAAGYALMAWPGALDIGRISFQEDPTARTARYRLEPIDDRIWEQERNELYAQSGWTMSTDVTGRLLYDHDGATHTANYHSQEAVSYQKTGLLASMMGPYDNHDIFATFSFPSGGAGQRGYLMYDILEMQDGYIVDSWFNYIHQQDQFQFPVKTAMEHEMTSAFSRDNTFQVIQTALQFTTHDEIPKLF